MEPAAQRNIRLTVEYDGSRFVGWQRQPNGLSVQEALETALARQIDAPVRLIGAGRTDTGVHARAQVANFHTASTLPLQAIHRGTLPHLPPGVTIVDARDMPPNFDARRSATLRWYRYFLVGRPVAPALAAPYLTHVRGRLDVPRMRIAAAALAGHHDFRAFRAVTCTARRTQLTLHEPVITELGDGILAIDFRCRSFLQNMVRILAGVLVACARGRMSQPAIEHAFTTGARPREAVTLPPNGLVLWQVQYPPEYELNATQAP